MEQLDINHRQNLEFLIHLAKFGMGVSAERKWIAYGDYPPTKIVKRAITQNFFSTIFIV